MFQRDLRADATEFESRLLGRLDHHEQITREREEAETSRLQSLLDERLTQMGEEIHTHRATTDEWVGRLDQRLEERLGAVDTRLEERLGGMDVRIEERLHALDSHFDQQVAVVDSRFDGRFEAIEIGLDERLAAANSQLDQQIAALDASLKERVEEIDTRVDQQMGSLDARLEERLGAIDTQTEERFTTIDLRVDERLEAIERQMDSRFEEIETRLDQRLESIERQVLSRSDLVATAQDERATRHEQSVDQRVEERLHLIERQMKEIVSDYVRGVDIRVDDRQAGIDRRIEDRFRGLDLRMDERMEAHELRTDRTLELNREGIIDRTDLMLQVFEQRLDRFRKLLAQRISATGEATLPVEQPIEPTFLDEGVRSFGKLIEEEPAGEESGKLPGQLFSRPDAIDPIYPGIVAWEKSSREGLNEFRPEEREIADYLRSFLEDPDDEQGYVQQHLRRLVGTIQRIPPPQRSTAQLLELGSLFSLAPAIQRFCGYRSIVGTSWWEGEEREVERTYRQLRGGNDQLTIPIHNFNVEQDPFPFADRTFRVVLCCELIEHLQRDPMHMLWECNRVLEEDGYLLLTTPNITSCRSIEGVLTGYSPYHFSQYNLDPPFDRHHREYAPAEVEAALRAAGFEVLQLETEDVWRRSNPLILQLLAEARLSTDLRGDNIFALARKIGAPLERYPKALYVP
jgi:SAM-dependent methyltransferase